MAIQPNAIALWSVGFHLRASIKKIQDWDQRRGWREGETEEDQRHRRSRWSSVFLYPFDLGSSMRGEMPGRSQSSQPSMSSAG